MKKECEFFRECKLHFETNNHNTQLNGILEQLNNISNLMNNVLESNNVDIDNTTNWIKQAKSADELKSVLNKVVSMLLEQKDRNLAVTSDLVKLTNELKEENKRLQTDSLLWINNRHALEQRLTELISNYNMFWNWFTLAILDIDKFKNINDTYWHLVWDKVLKYFADFLLKYFKPEQLFRFWWEEIVILIEDNDNSVFKMISNVLIELNKTRVMYKKEIHIPLTFSWWLAAIAKWDNRDSLYEKADKLLYEAKNNWRNQIKK